MHKAHPFLILFALFAITWSAMAQSPAECTALVERAIATMQGNCDNLDRNSACYGYNAVSAVFTQDVPSDYFTRPADRAGLLDLLTLQTAAFDLANDRWGIAVINMQANLPNTLPGQAVTLLLVGDATVENRVSPLDIAPIAPPVTVSVLQNGIAYAHPDATSAPVGEIAADSQLQADALNQDGAWLRVVVNDIPAWIQRQATNSPTELTTLPVITSTIQSPMQAFYFTTGIGAVGCQEAPNTITVRSPKNTTVDLSINGIDVRIGSTITLRNTAPNQIAFTVQEGHLETATGEYIEEGNTLIAQTDLLGQIVRWEDIRPATSEEVQLGNVADRILEVERDTSLIPSPTRTPETRPSTDNTPTNANEVIHIVVAGETLFRIARNYNASMPAIVARNNLTDPRSIFVGQRLIIPNPNSGFVGLNEPNPPVEVRPNPTPSNNIIGTTIGAVDCSTFMPTDPLQGMLYGENTFRWTAAGGATSYRVIVSNLNENRSVAFDAPAPLLSLVGVVDQGTVGGGFDFAWRIQALQNGAVICDSGDRVMQRASFRIFTATWACDGNNNIVVSYSGVLPDGFVTAKFYNPFTASFVEQRGPGQQGTLIFNGISSGYTGMAIASSGEQVALTPDPLNCP